MQNANLALPENSAKPTQGTGMEGTEDNQMGKWSSSKKAADI